MRKCYLPTQHQVGSDINRYVAYAQSLEKEDDLPRAIQLWETILSVEAERATHAQAASRLAKIYQDWNELFAAQRFLGRAVQLNPTDAEIRADFGDINRRIAENQETIFEERERKNSDLIVSLFRIATGLKLLNMDKAVQAYPLMKSRTKIYPNAAVAMHLLTDIIITDDDKNSAIEFLEERDWLVNTAHDRYAITHSGLQIFYSELAKLHDANEIYDEAAACYEQAFWLDDSTTQMLYRKVFSEAKSEDWDAGLATLDRIAVHLAASPPTQPEALAEGVDPAEYHTAAAKIYASAFQSTKDSAIGIRAIAACEAALAINKKNRGVSKLLKSLSREVSNPSAARESQNK